MVLTVTPGVPVLGTQSVRWVSTLSSLTAPSLAQVTAAAPASRDISCDLIAAGWKPDQDVAKGAPSRRLCERNVYERFGITTRKLADAMYIIRPQDASGSAGKLTYETLTEGLTGYFVERLGLDSKTVDYAIGQFVNIYPVTLGPALIVAEDSETGDYVVKQAIALNGAVVDNVALVA